MLEVASVISFEKGSQTAAGFLHCCRWQEPKIAYNSCNAHSSCLDLFPFSVRFNPIQLIQVTVRAVDSQQPDPAGGLLRRHRSRAFRGAKLWRDSGLWGRWWPRLRVHDTRRGCGRLRGIAMQERAADWVPQRRSLLRCNCTPSILWAEYQETQQRPQPAEFRSFRYKRWDC